MIGLRTQIDPLARNNFRQRRTLAGASSGMIPEWRTVHVEYIDFTAAATSESITALVLPARHSVLQAFIEAGDAWSATGLTALSLSLGISGNLTKYVPAVNVYSGSGFLLGVNPDVESITGDTNLLIGAASVGANLNTLTAGSAVVHMLIGRVPSGGNT